MVTETGLDSRQPLVSPILVREDFTTLAFAGSHGAHGAHLGAGILYYSLAQMVRAQVAVCIGSGGGFVPSLVRRAQLDAGITPAATYLVDANLPDLAFGSPGEIGGWMTAENPFLTRESDITVLPMLSADAVKLFSAQGVSIDYLHIDGDHSRDGMLADFRDYASLVSADGVVTFHDLAMPSIAAALATILAEYPDWDHVGFAEIGAGTGVLRRRQRGEVKRRPPSGPAFVDANRRVTLQTTLVQDAVIDSQERARYERWSYLTSPAYQMRYRLAAAELDTPGGTIVEVGGFPNSVVGMLTQTHRVHAVEPYAPPVYRANIEAAAQKRGIKWQCHSLTLSALPIRPGDLGAFNLLALGFDLTTGEESVEGMLAGLSNFARLLTAAKRSVVEIPGYRPSMLVWEGVVAALKPRIVVDVTMDLRKDPAAEIYFVRDERALRRMMVIEGTDCPDVEAESVRAALRTVAESAMGLLKARAKPADPDYALGTVLKFAAGGNADNYLRDGWRPSADPGYRWSSGSEATLLLRLSREELGATAMFTARLTVDPLVVASVHPRQRFSMSVNGRMLCEEVTLTARTTLTISIPRDCLLLRPLTQIVFLHPDHRRPIDIVPGNKTMGSLAFRFFDFVLVPASDPGRDLGPAT